MELGEVAEGYGRVTGYEGRGPVGLERSVVGDVASYPMVCTV